MNRCRLLNALCCALLAMPAWSAEVDRVPLNPPSLHTIPMPKPIFETKSRIGNRSYKVFDQTYKVLPTAEGYRAKGKASWYGEKFHGHQTANGEIYDMYKFTAAHRSLPLPSWLKVTNLENGLAIYVRVNDRGPFHHQRIIDLSYVAAARLGMLEQGTAKVLLQHVSVDPPDKGLSAQVAPLTAQAASELYVLQVGLFGEAARAENVAKELRPLKLPAISVNQVVRADNRMFFRVQVGPAGFAQIKRARAAIAISMSELGVPLIKTFN